ncbi:hypothetical protein NQ176_g383 [Zarea fungicola]|uniref:Uncharacterized protein n=1 Tax=Zarea fungicola TaxID=93591 RepID=A0ACC1NY94_9HYPO|nr:hypothetical protein NQ176_g383 [Lecanicillium fungicola]
MSGSSSNAVDYAEKNMQRDLELARETTAGGHPNDRSQPALPTVHRKFANPAPLGLLSFATGIFLISIFGVHARNLQTPNVLISVLMFFGGVCQFISGIMEFIAGNTFGATVFPSYGAFNLSYAMIYIPGTGIIASYTDKETGELNAQFTQALAMYVWAWFILTVIFTVSAMRSSWILFLDLFVLSVELLFLAAGYMTGVEALLTTGNALGFVVAFLSYWAGCAGLWSGGLTPINLPTFSMYKED